MSTLRILSLALSLGVAGVAVSQAAPVSLNVNLGLWEVTSTGQTSGAPPIPTAQLDALPPAQRARIEAAMSAAMAASNKPHVYKECVTAESLQRGLNPDPQMANNCKQTVVSSSPTAMEVQIECTGRQKTTGTVSFETSGPAAMSGTVDMTVTDGTHTMNVTRQLQGKWLGADCGTVKPSG